MNCWTKGPHAYLWDVKEGFSLTAEVVYRSGVTGFLKIRLKKGLIEIFWMINILTLII